MLNFNDLKSFLVDLILPNRCPFCNGFIHWDKLNCGKCYNEIEWVDDDELDIKPSDTIVYYDRCFAAMYYSGVVKNAVINLKRINETNFANIVASEIASKVSCTEYYGKIDCIIPVPMGRKKLKKVGFNHSEVICDEISAALGIPKNIDCLFKYDSKIAQHSMNAEERAENVKGLFFTGDNSSLVGKTVMLCDDVMTTGSTLNECSRLLREIGADKVIIAVAAKTMEIL